MMSDKLQVLKNMPIVPISQAVADEMEMDPDWYDVTWYRMLHIVPLVDGEIGCHMRARARYVLDKAS
jgi:hypothetical protein